MKPDKNYLENTLCTRLDHWVLLYAFSYLEKKKKKTKEKQIVKAK